jgi:hypothetical protein
MTCPRWSASRSIALVLVSLVLWTAVLVPPALSASSEDDTLRNVGFVFTPREILFFSAPAGQWTSVRLDAGERVLQRGAHGNVAAVVTSQRAIGFSAPLNVTQEFSVPEEETLEAFKVEGNVITFVTRRRVYAFSAFIGKWAVMDRFQLGR